MISTLGMHIKYIGQFNPFRHNNHSPNMTPLNSISERAYIKHCYKRCRNKGSSVHV